jgi:hypothetical protein
VKAGFGKQKIITFKKAPGSTPVWGWHVQDFLDSGELVALCDHSPTACAAMSV